MSAGWDTIDMERLAVHNSLVSMADEKKSDSEGPTQIGIYYQRSRHYRTMHADGAQAGLTPRGAIQFMLFSDLKPMPEFVLHRVTPEGTLGESVEEVVKEGFVREVEVNVVMDAAVTTQFVAVLQSLLMQIKSLQEQGVTKAEAQGSVVPPAVE